MDILQLPGWMVTGMNMHDNCLVIEATYNKVDSSCHKCGVVGNLYRHGTKVIKYRDIPVRMVPTIIDGTVQRYRCKECSETFVQKPEGIDDFRRMTERLVQFIKEQCIPYSFTHVAEIVGCVEGTVRAIAGEQFDQFDDEYKPYLPEWMGMDETKLDGKLRGVITDIGLRRPVDLLHDRDKPTMLRWLSQFKKLDTVKGLATDMWPAYRDAARIVFPGLPVVVDKFHLVRMANKAMEDIRIGLAKKEPKAVGRDWMRRKALLRMRPHNLNDKGRFNLQMWLENEPEIAVAYNLKESFYAIYDAPTKEDGGKRLDAWRESVPERMKRGKKSFQPLITATENWQDEILAFYDHPITNGYTEAWNGVVKVINRNARGYSFDVLRAKVLGKKPRERKAIYAPVGLQRIVGDTPTTGYVCASCGGMYRMTYWFYVPPLNNNHIENMLAICPDCNKRFHTQDANHDESLST